MRGNRFGIGLAAAAAATVLAQGIQIQAKTVPGSYAYSFENAVDVNLTPALYEGTTAVQEENRLVFYEKDNYREWVSKGVLNGGRLFSAFRTKNVEAVETPGNVLIGFNRNDGYYYFAEKPLDRQEYPYDEELVEKYEQASKNVDAAMEAASFKEGVEYFSPEVLAFKAEADGFSVMHDGTSKAAVENGEIRITREDRPNGFGTVVKKLGEGEKAAEWLFSRKAEYEKENEGRMKKKPKAATAEVGSNPSRRLNGFFAEAANGNGTANVATVVFCEETDGGVFAYEATYVCGSDSMTLASDGKTYGDLILAAETLSFEGKRAVPANEKG